MRWSDVEPVLRATYRLLEAEDRVTPEQINEALQRDPDDALTGRALAYLHRDDYIDGIAVDQVEWPIFVSAAPKGLRAASGWPSENGDSLQVDLLLQLLDERIAAETTTETDKGRLRQMRDGLAGASRDLGVEVMAAYLARITGAAE